MRLIAIVFVSILVSCSDSKDIAVAERIDRSQFLEIIKNSDSDKVQVINFWATWCAPCVEELPAFETASKMYEEEIEVILISLDDADLIKDKVNPFLVDNEISTKVVVFDDPYSSEWIPMVDQHWDGAIPVTIIKRKDKNRFYNRTFTSAALQEEIEDFL